MDDAPHRANAPASANAATPDNRHNDASSELVEVYLDAAEKPIASYRPPLRFELDTAQLEDGPHTLRVVARDTTGRRSSRNLQFTVRNGPGIHIDGIADRDVVEGSVPVLVNAYGGQDVAEWQPDQAETPSAIPTWTWVVFILIAAFGVFYGVQQWTPPANFATTPTYGTWNLSPGSPNPTASAAASPRRASAAPQPSTTTKTDTTRAKTGTTQPTAPTPAAPTGPTPPTAQPAARPNAARQDTASAGQGYSGAAASVSASHADGQALYQNTCSACHQAGGQGVPGVFPPLAGDPVVTAEDPTQHILTVLQGLKGKNIAGVAYGAPMPSFGGSLSDVEIAAIINHERTSWGNQAPQVTAAQVTKLRNQ